ncbi:MAG: hypothetical protein AB7O55_08030 [Lautropia sp.]
MNRGIATPQASRSGRVNPGRPLTARRYAAAVHVDVKRRAGAASPVDATLAALGLRRDVVLTLPQANVAAINAARSDLAATLGERIATAMAAALDLVSLPLGFVPTPDPLVMAWHPRHAADPAHRRLRERLLALLAQAAGARRD